jgi:uncharacterized protein YndB with AHSA1/START domain
MANVEASIVLKRTYDVPVARLWRAWSTAGELAQWYRPSIRHTIDFAECDFRVGGVYRVGFSLGDESMIEVGRYIEIIAMQKIVFEEQVKLAGAPHHSTLDQIDFAPLDGSRTQLVVTSTGYEVWNIGGGINGLVQSLAQFVEHG